VFKSPRDKGRLWASLASRWLPAADTLGVQLTTLLMRQLRGRIVINRNLLRRIRAFLEINAPYLEIGKRALPNRLKALGVLNLVEKPPQNES
jgi:hypothetical protein